MRSLTAAQRQCVFTGKDRHWRQNGGGDFSRNKFDVNTTQLCVFCCVQGEFTGVNGWMGFVLARLAWLATKPNESAAHLMSPTRPKCVALRDTRLSPVLLLWLWIMQQRSGEVNFLQWIMINDTSSFHLNVHICFSVIHVRFVWRLKAPHYSRRYIISL